MCRSFDVQVWLLRIVLSRTRNVLALLILKHLSPLIRELRIIEFSYHLHLQFMLNLKNIDVLARTRHFSLSLTFLIKYWCLFIGGIETTVGFFILKLALDIQLFWFIFEISSRIWNLIMFCRILKPRTLRVEISFRNWPVQFIFALWQISSRPRTCVVFSFLRSSETISLRIQRRQTFLFIT